MKLKDIENPQVMTINELNDLFKRWFPNGISKEEGYVLWSIFSNNNRYMHFPSRKIIETGTFRFFGGFLSHICNDVTDYLDFYMSDGTLDYIDVEIIKRVHRIVNPSIEHIEEYWDEETKKKKRKGEKMRYEINNIRI